MPKSLKILAGTIIFLGILSGIFLLTAAKKTPTTPVSNSVNKTVQTKKQANVAEKTMPKKNTQMQTVQTIEEQKQNAALQWQQCKQKTLAAKTNLIWNVQITEGIPDGGTYAKGVLNKDVNLPVRVIIKSDSANVDKIKQMLVVGKMPILHGNCTNVAEDGVVVLQVF